MEIHQANRSYKSIIHTAVPVLLFLLVIVGYVITEMVDALWFKPWLLTIGVFYWTLFSPRSLPIWLALALGLLEDGLAGTPFGLYGLGILIMHHLTFSQRQSLMHSPFTVIITGFWVNCFVVMFIMALVMLLIGLPLTIWSLMSWFVTSILFVPVAVIFDVVRQKMMKD